MSRLALALGLGALLALGLVVVLARGGGRSAGPTGPAEPAPRAEPGAREALRPAASAPSAREREPAALAPRAAAAPATEPAPGRSPAAPANEGAGSVTLAGTVVVHDAGGRAHPAEDGRLRLLVEGERREARNVPVRTGTFVLAVPERALLTVAQVELGGRGAVLVPALRRAAVPEEGRLELLARWPAESVVRVQDEGTRDELVALTVLRVPGRMPHEARAHPGPDPPGRPLLEGASSPFVLPAPTPEELATGKASLLVRGPDHAWGAVDVDLRVGGERLLLLRRGGTLRVTLLGPPPRGCALRLRRVEGLTPFPEVEWPLAEDERVVEIPALAAETWLVQLARGDPLGGAEVFAAATATVRAGTTVDLALEPTHGPDGGPVRVEGRVAFSEGWAEPGGFALWILPEGTGPGQRVDESEMSPESHGPAGGRSFAWSRELEPGAYRGVVEPHGFARDFEVEPGMAPVELVVPLPASVSLSVVDEASGLESGMTSVSWAWVEPGTTARSFRRATRGAPGPIEFAAPAGTIEVGGLERGWVLPYTRVELRPGHNDVVVEARAACGIELRVEDGDAVLPIEWNGGVEIRQTGGDGWVMGFDGTGAGARYTLSQPGTYRLTLRDLAGFEPVPDREVVVPPGEFVRVVVELERLP